ncbi:MAG: lysine--tRNA ligase [Proteobacteria bacterium]|uniref:Lysine--tRNA ligase n=1 Tax=Candidatus Avisuccinivibrio stercorigallinarum TaxID=2840704 RepID=A0A9D9DBM7_9GAMM|nr:lysine--tRNA ligase [Candidatus Avisuccinivibrio stercorigallinarum]
MTEVTAVNTENLNNEMAERRLKLEALREKGQAYPNDFRRDAISSDIIAACGSKDEAQLEADKKTYTIAGRMMTRRIMGKASFATLQDMGGKIQIYVTRDALPEGQYQELFKKLDLGDIIGVTGYAFKTKTGELTLHVTSLRLLVKALRPLPEKYKGLTDQEARCRQRYLDLIANEDSRRTFQIRTKIVSFIRKYMDSHSFMEVETPMMHVIPGGANAKPFITHHNALDIDMYLRIAPELFLKRLVVGGFERVYEINRNFRNEGIDVRHNPEFTMIEFYMAYHDYNDLIDFTEDLFRQMAKEVLGTTKLHYGKEGEPGLDLDFDQPFDRLTMKEAIVKYGPGITMEDLEDTEKAKAWCEKLHLELMPAWELGHYITALFEELVEEKLQQPTFITSYPAVISPLARRSDDNPEFTDRFEFFIGGREMGNGFSELNDPDDQAGRFRQQAEQKKHGDDEAMYYDEDYITALQHGLPPTAGEGIGIDRVVMLFSNSRTIRDVILFPTLRPQK